MSVKLLIMSVSISDIIKAARLDNQGGFGVVEIVVTLLVIGIVSTAFFSITISTNAINDQATDLIFINGMAQRKMEELRSSGFISLSDGTVDFSDEFIATIGKPNTAQYTISTVSTDVKQVSVQVVFDQYGESQTYDYSTYVSELGLSQ